MMAAAVWSTWQVGDVSMPEAVLLGESTVRESGVGPTLTLSEFQGRLLFLTLKITRVIDRQSLELSVWGSEDGEDWGTKPLLSFPRKYYCGSYAALLDLPDRPEVRYLRANWTLTRWANDDRRPLFTVSLLIQEPTPRVFSATCL